MDQYSGNDFDITLLSLIINLTKTDKGENANAIL